MPERAQVTSVEAIDSFRGDLIVFAAKARAAVEEIADEVQRTRVWLQHQQRTHWEKECRRLTRTLEEVQQEFFSAKLSNYRSATATHALAVERAKHALREAERKLDSVKKWARELDNRAEPLLKQVEQLQTFLATDLVKAAAFLGNVVKALQAYTAFGLAHGPLPETEPAPSEISQAAEPPPVPSPGPAPNPEEGKS